MARNSVQHALAGLVVFASFLIFGFGRGTVAGPAANNDQQLATAIDRIEDNQAKLAERLDRLESRYAPSGSPSLPARAFVPDGSPSTAAAPGGSGGMKLSPAEQEALAAKQRHDMEDRLISDPVAPQWAAANEKTIGDFLSRDNLSKQQLPAPSAYRVECRSHLSRISMTFADDAQASQTQAMLLMGIGQSLPSAQTFLVPQSDGSVEMLVFAGDPAHVR
jgi:hypothetical protein